MFIFESFSAFSKIYAIKSNGIIDKRSIGNQVSIYFFAMTFLSVISYILSSSGILVKNVKTMSTPNMPSMT